MSGEGSSVAMMRGIIAGSEIGEAVGQSQLQPAVNPGRVADLRELVDDLDLMVASREIDIASIRRARNELAELADALDGFGGVGNGFAVVPLVELDALAQGAPIGPPEDASDAAAGGGRQSEHH